MRATDNILEFHFATVGIDPNGLDVVLALKNCPQHENLTTKQRVTVVMNYLVAEGFLESKNYRITVQ